MKGCRPRQGGEFKDGFLPRLLFDLRQNTRDEPLVWEPSCRWANSQSHSVQCWYFVNSNKGDQWMDPDNASDKYAELMNTDRARLMDIFWVHWNRRRWSVQKSSNKGPLLETHVSVRLNCDWGVGFPAVVMLPLVMESLLFYSVSSFYWYYFAITHFWIVVDLSSNVTTAIHRWGILLHLLEMLCYWISSWELDKNVQ